MRALFRLTLVAVLALPVASRAESLRDDASGLQITAPPRYAARAIAPGRGQTARFEVKTPADKDTGCQVAFTPAPQNNRLSQAEIDALMRGETWREAARSALSGVYDVAETFPLPPGKREGFVIIGDFKDRPGMPPRARDIRTLFVIQETPRGRTSTVCVGERAGFEGRRAEFVALAEGNIPP